MELEIEVDKRVSRRYFAELMKSTIDYDFSPAPEYALTLFGFPIHGYPLPPKIRHKAKKIISDVDGVWNTQQIFGVYIELLSRVNDGIKERKDKIFKSVKQTRSGNVDGPVESVEESLRESDFRKKQHDWACVMVPYYVPLTPNSIPCLLEIKSMYYDIEFFSGSPDLAVKHFVGRNMRLAGFDLEIAEDCVTATEYEFDDDGVFVKIKNPMLYEYKNAAVERRLKETVGTTKGLNCVLSDEPGDVHMVQSFINPFILTTDASELPTSISIAVPEANSDMMVIPPVIRKAEIALGFALGYPPAVQKEALKSALKFRRICELIERTERDYKILRDGALKNFNDYKKLIDKLFSTAPGFTGLDSIVSELENATSKNEIQLAASNLLKQFRKYSPHPDTALELLKYL